MTVVYFFLIIFFSLLLVKATDILLINLKSFASRTRVGAFAISSLIVALGTSLPELFVGLTSAFKGEPSLSLGNIIGANIANLSLIIGGAALLGGSVAVKGNFLKTDVFWAFLVGAAPMILLFDKSLNRLDGLILLALYAFYQVAIFKAQTPPEVEEGIIQRLLRRLNHKESRKEIGWIFLGIALLLFSADMIVYFAKLFAITLNIPILLVGLILVSLGTCLPELVFEIKAIKQCQPQMVFGNLLGSIVTNATLVIGLVSVISPIRIEAFAQYLVATMGFVIVFGAFYFFTRTKHRLECWEGAFLVGFYLAFILSEFIHP